MQTWMLEKLVEKLEEIRCGIIDVEEAVKSKTEATEKPQVSPSNSSDLLGGEKVAIDRLWGEYPLGTKANAIGGGYWIKEERGWRWCTGATFPRPGGDATTVTLPTT